MSQTNMRYLTNEMVRELLSIPEALKIIEEVYRDHGRGKAILSAPSSLGLKAFDAGASFKVKGAYVETYGVAGFRLLGTGTSHMGFCYLCDPKTSLPMGIVDESWQYLLRTGITAAVSAKYLARPGSRILGLLGCGGIASPVLMGLKALFPLDRVQVTSRRKDSRERFAKDMEEALSLKTIPVDSPREAVENADIVVTITDADEALVSSDWLKQGAFVCSMGSGQELDIRLLDWADKFVVDDFDFCLVLGDVSAWVRKGLRREEEIRTKLWAEIGDVVAGNKPGRASEKENILAIIQGMASCDIALAKHVLDKAVQKGIGDFLNLWGRGKHDDGFNRARDE
jgi:alanine dehydrogenase